SPPEAGNGFASQNPPSPNYDGRNSSPEAASPPSHAEPRKDERRVRFVRSESANGAAESCCHGQIESASVARGNARSNLQAPQAAAQASAANASPEAGNGFVSQNPPSSNYGGRNSSPEAGSPEPEAGP